MKESRNKGLRLKSYYLILLVVTVVGSIFFHRVSSRYFEWKKIQRDLSAVSFHLIDEYVQTYYMIEGIWPDRSNQMKEFIHNSMPLNETSRLLTCNEIEFRVINDSLAVLLDLSEVDRLYQPNSFSQFLFTRSDILIRKVDKALIGNRMHENFIYANSRLDDLDSALQVELLSIISELKLKAYREKEFISGSPPVIDNLNKLEESEFDLFVTKRLDGEIEVSITNTKAHAQYENLLSDIENEIREGGVLNCFRGEAKVILQLRLISLGSAQ